MAAQNWQKNIAIEKKEMCENASFVFSSLTFSQFCTSMLMVKCRSICFWKKLKRARGCFLLAAILTGSYPSLYLPNLFRALASPFFYFYFPHFFHFILLFFSFEAPRSAFDRQLTPSSFKWTDRQTWWSAYIHTYGHTDRHWRPANLSKILFGAYLRKYTLRSCRFFISLLSCMRAPSVLLEKKSIGRDSCCSMSVVFS